MTRPWFPYAIVTALVLAALGIAGCWTGWKDLWLTPDQRGRVLVDHGRPAEAADAFRDPLWRGVASFRAGDFKTAAQRLGSIDTAEGAYDAGTALVMLGKYDEAVKRYDRALELRPDWAEAAANREIARIRAERIKAEGGVTDDTESAPDQIVYDKSKKGGAETTVVGGQSMSNEAVRAMWLKRVQTRPADFLKAKFAYQLQAQAAGTAP
jgi:Ca-activated chloride channel family protein